MSKEQMTRHPIRLTETSRRGEESSLLLRVVCRRTTSELYSGCENAEGCLRKSEEDFRRKHHSQEASTPTGVEQLATMRLVGG